MTPEIITDLFHSMSILMLSITTIALSRRVARLARQTSERTDA